MQPRKQINKYIIDHHSSAMVIYVSYNGVVNRDVSNAFGVACYLDPMPQLVSMAEKASYDFAS